MDRPAATNKCMRCRKYACVDILCSRCIEAMNKANHEHRAHLERMGLPIPVLCPAQPPRYSSTFNGRSTL